MASKLRSVFSVSIESMTSVSLSGAPAQLAIELGAGLRVAVGRYRQT